MCGIFGYIGKDLPLSLLIEGLSRLEYRGYDSCGIAAIKDREFFLRKRPGKIGALQEDLKKNLRDTFGLGILHTRWATHGKPNQINAHPHFDCKNEIALAHNGIIENYLSLKNELLKEGHVFKSETDTEVIVHLIEKFYKGSLEDALGEAIKRLQGSFALSVITNKEPHKLIGARKGSPLIVGLGTNGNFLASDIPAILPFTRRVIYLKDEEIAILTRDSAEIFDFRNKPVKVEIEKLTMRPEDAGKKGFEHFMLKEIFEQPEVLKKIISLYHKGQKIIFPGLGFSEDFIKKLKNVFITACGTAYHAGYVAKYFLEKYAGLDVEIDTSSEFRYRSINLSQGDLLITISQSGETADTLCAVRQAKTAGVKVLSI
jgi:glucosamine--fructose-6-phosphate aminotransferase (isomerizing)